MKRTRKPGRVYKWKGWQVQRKSAVMGGEPWFLRVYRTRREAMEAWPNHFAVGVVKLVRVTVQDAK